MDQFEKIVLKAPPKGMSYALSEGEDGKWIVELVSNLSAVSERVVENSQNEENFFTKITAEDREKVKKWFAMQNGKTSRELKFLRIVGEAIQKVNYDYWIATLEPSVENGKVYYAKGHEVAVGFSSDQWNAMARNYKPERGSRLCNLHELFMWYALRIVNNLWTLDDVANGSSYAGNSYASSKHSKPIGKTGEKECGGYSDGLENTYKIVTYENCYALVGADYSVDCEGWPVSCFYCDDNPFFIRYFGTSILVLTR